MIFKCKICGGSLAVKQGERVTECEYCGVKQTIPGFIEPKTQEIYNRASAYLMNNEFDKAENLYNQILFENKEDADAYWNVLMCRYGVTYVKDPASGKYIPTCNRTLYSPIFNDENYQNALKYADEKQKALYIENAHTIDNIQKGILSVSKKEKPFDIFISYKETDINGARTKDSIKAQDLYDKLTAEGYKVFFSRITLEDKIGTEYEPYIYAALASSKVMITVSSSKENLEAVWVKNEWSRFLSFAGKDSSKTLIPLYFDMDKDELPDDFAHLSAYDMKVDGFEQELIRGIKKLIPLPVMLLERRRKRNKLLKRVGLAAAACVVIGAICAIPWFMKLPEYNAAMQLYYDKNYPEATWAFDAMGGYRNSEEMKEKCELSWRKSLAAVVTGNGDETYIITPNSDVDTHNMGFNQAIDGITLDTHGAVTSIAEGLTNLYALHADGYVDNIGQNNNMTDESEWHNIVQIYPMINGTSVALRSDGKMLCSGDITKEFLIGSQNNKPIYSSNSWLEPLSSWNNIVSFDAYTLTFSGDSARDRHHQVVVVGVESDGTLHVVYYTEPFCADDITEDIKNIENIKNVKSIDVALDDNSLNVVALTKEQTIITYIDGQFVEYEAKEVVEVSFDTAHSMGLKEPTVMALMADGRFIQFDTNKTILKDVVSLQGRWLVTRSGSLYSCGRSFDGGIDIQTEAQKVYVFDEWIERMK